VSTVLVVEDDRAILDAVAYNLRREGHTVLVAGDGVEGLRLAREHEPDVIVLDIMLPRMSGLDVCRVVREERPVPIVMLTARDTERDKVAGLDIGADDYMTKPFSMRELVARVRALLRRDRLSREAAEPASARAPVLEGGGVTLDTLAHEVRKDAVALALRPKEYELLEYLMRHAGQALSREQILEAVWGYSYTGETRTVDVHIRWLREKVESDASAPAHIVTVRGVGYKFVP
jgi:DNA-binding response OmpR family regulator